MGGWLTPPTIPAEKICRVLQIPADRDIVMAVNGALYALTLRSNWSQFGAVTPDEIAVSMLNMWNDYLQSECGVTCEQIIDCITNDDDVKAAFNAWLIDQITSNTAVQAALSQQFNPNTPGGQATPEYRAKNQYSSANGCDNNSGWGHIRSGLIDRAMQRVEDVLEQIELTTDNQEMLAQSLGSIPGLGLALEGVGVESWLAFFDNVRSFLKDAFEAGDTLEKRDKMACDLFCIWQIDCTLSFDQIANYFQVNAQVHLPGWEDAFTTFENIVETLANPSEVTGEWVVDALLGVEFGFQEFINNWFGVQIGITSNDLLLGVANDGWMAVCDECPTTLEAQNVGLFARCGEGVISTVEFEDGVPFDVVAWEEGPGTSSFIIALKLPVGNWNITLNSIDGSIVPPANPAVSAYAWNDTGGTFHYVQWDAPATPADFGSHDTQEAVFDPWCTTDEFNAALFNHAPFTANFTATAI